MGSEWRTAVCTVSLKKLEIGRHGGVLSASSVPHVCAQVPCVANRWSPEPSSSKGMHHGWTNMLTRKVCAVFVLEKHSENCLGNCDGRTGCLSQTFAGHGQGWPDDRQHSQQQRRGEESTLDSGSWRSQRQSSILVLRFVVEGLVSCTLHADVSVRVGDIESRQFGSAVLSGIMGVFHV